MTFSRNVLTYITRINDQTISSQESNRLRFRRAPQCYRFKRKKKLIQIGLRVVFRLALAYTRRVDPTLVFERGYLLAWKAQAFVFLTEKLCRQRLAVVRVRSSYPQVHRVITTMRIALFIRFVESDMNASKKRNVLPCRSTVYP